MLAPLINIEQSVLRYDAQWATPGIVKLPEDLDRFRAVISVDRPDVLVECGTWLGGSARWFASLGVDVVTVDISPRATKAGADPRITWMVGDTADPDVAAMVRGFVADRRAMVVLDSAHTAEHVAAEIELYGPVVTPGCHLVVEDGMVRWLPDNAIGGSPLDAVEQLLAANPDWERDEAIEAMSETSMDPAGWWKRASRGA